MINSISITDLKQNTSKIINRVNLDEKSLVILQRSKAAAVLVDPEYYKVLEKALEDIIDLQAIEERKNEQTSSLEEVTRKLKDA
jgi:prevent-host-death family protein